jgi:hypothetical protein
MCVLRITLVWLFLYAYIAGGIDVFSSHVHVSEHIRLVSCYVHVWGRNSYGYSLCAYFGNTLIWLFSIYLLWESIRMVICYIHHWERIHTVNCYVYVSETFVRFSICTCFGTHAYVVGLFGVTVLGSAFDLRCCS